MGTGVPFSRITYVRSIYAVSEYTVSTQVLTPGNFFRSHPIRGMRTLNRMKAAYSVVVLPSTSGSVKALVIVAVEVIKLGEVATRSLISHSRKSAAICSYDILKAVKSVYSSPAFTVVVRAASKPKLITENFYIIVMLKFYL